MMSFQNFLKRVNEPVCVSFTFPMARCSCKMANHCNDSIKVLNVEVVYFIEDSFSKQNLIKFKLNTSHNDQS